MQITKITVSYQETAKSGDYANVKPFAEAEVVVEYGDHWTDTLKAAMATVRGIVQAQVDDAREANDLPPIYTTEPRYIVLARARRRDGGLPDTVVIVPSDLAVNWKAWYRPHYGAFRYATARRLAEEQVRGYSTPARLVECRDLRAYAELLDAIESEDGAIEDAKRQEQAEREARWAAEHAARAALARQDDDEEDG